MRPDYSRQGEEPYRNPDQYDAADMQAVVAIANDLAAALSAAVGRMMNVKIDLDTGVSKAKAGAALASAIKTAEDALAKAKGGAS